MNYDTVRLIIPQADHTYTYVEECTEFDAADVRTRHYGLYRCPKCYATVGGPSHIGDKNPKMTTVMPREGCPMEWEWSTTKNKWIKKPDPIQEKLRNLYGHNMVCEAEKNKDKYIIKIWFKSFENRILSELNQNSRLYLPGYNLKIESASWLERPIDFTDFTEITYPILQLVLKPIEDKQ